MKYTNVLYKDNEVFKPVIREFSPIKAIEHILIYELGYGGHLVEFNLNQVKTITRVLANVDHTTIEGTQEEMAELLRAIAMYFSVSFMASSGVGQKWEERRRLISELSNVITHNVPKEIVELGKNIAENFSIVKTTMIGLIGTSLDNSEKYFDRLNKLDREQLLMVYDLVKFQDQHIDEVLSLFEEPINPTKTNNTVAKIAAMFPA